jgi:hypothetical protein
MLGIKLGLDWPSKKGVVIPGPPLRSGQFRLDGDIVGCERGFSDDSWTEPVVNVNWQEGQWVELTGAGGLRIELGYFTPDLQPNQWVMVTGPAYNNCSGPD